MTQLANRVVADLLVVIHFSYVAFVVVGFLLTLAGIVCRWRWVRDFHFRTLHLAAIAIVVAESVLGVPCPLTVWEQQLRRAAGQVSYRGAFVAEWVHEILYLDLPEWAFTLIYGVFGLAVVATFVFSPPRLPRGMAGRWGQARGVR